MGVGIFWSKRLFYYFLNNNKSFKCVTHSCLTNPVLQSTHHSLLQTTLHPMSLLPSTLSDISDHAMQEIWHRTPIDFQREAIPRLLMMRCTPNIPQALLLVQGTGGGKSAVAQTVGVVDCGVTLVIEELLSVATDQKTKVKSASNAYGPVLAYQLDSVKNPALVDKLKSKLLQMKTKSNSTIFLYSSPECLMSQPWRSLMVSLIRNGVLKLVCIDEIHLYVMFGVTFRKEFVNLRDTFFQHLIDETRSPPTNSPTNLPCYLKVPLLLMTATFNPTLINLIESMIGIKILRENYLWSSRDKMARRNITINIKFTTQTTRYIKTVLHGSMCGNLNKKCIVYTNTASCLDQLKVDIEQWLNSSDDIKGDVLIIHGDMKKEVNFVSAERFTESIADPQILLDSNKFYARILLATAGSNGVGLDSQDIYSVTRIGYPTSVIDMAQEMGRCGRGPSSSGSAVTGEFHLVLSLNDFVYLNQRLYLPEDSGNKPTVKPLLTIQEEITMQRDNLLHRTMELYFCLDNLEVQVLTMCHQSRTSCSLPHNTSYDLLASYREESQLPYRMERPLPLCCLLLWWEYCG